MTIIQSTRKTGELLLQLNQQEARLYFLEGNLVHAVMGKAEGLAVVDEVAHWKSGEYEFHPGVKQDQLTVLRDLEEAMVVDSDMNTAVDFTITGSEEPPPDRYAFKTKLDQAAAASPRKELDPKLSNLLTEFASSTKCVTGAWLINRTGTVVAAAAGTAVSPQLAGNLQNLLHFISEEYPRRPIRRIMIEDHDGQVVFQAVDRTTTLLVVAGKGAATGVLSVAVGKLAQNLADRKLQ